jgi:hypothetical protein
MKIALLVVLLTGFTFIALSQPVKENGQLRVKGTQLVNQAGNPVMLAGVSYGWHNWCPRFYNKEWSIADKNETCSMLKTSASDSGNWKEEDLKESGIKTRELLRKLAGLDE